MTRYADLSRKNEKKITPNITKQSLRNYVQQNQSFSQTESPSERKYASSSYISYLSNTFMKRWEKRIVVPFTDVTTIQDIRTGK